jgi:hypothetical protein
MPHLPPAHHETGKHDSPNETKVKENQNETVPDSNLNLTKSMTHHNQTKELITWFLNLPLDVSSDNKNAKFKGRIQDPMKHSYKTKSQWKAQECHVEEGKPQKPANSTKSGKVKQNGKKELRKPHRSKKSSKPRQKLKINTKAQKAQNQHSPWNQLHLTLSMQALPLR